MGNVQQVIFDVELVISKHSTGDLRLYPIPVKATIPKSDNLE